MATPSPEQRWNPGCLASIAGAILVIEAAFIAVSLIAFSSLDALRSSDDTINLFAVVPLVAVVPLAASGIGVVVGKPWARRIALITAVVVAVTNFAHALTPPAVDPDAGWSWFDVALMSFALVAIWRDKPRHLLAAPIHP